MVFMSKSGSKPGLERLKSEIKLELQAFLTSELEVFKNHYNTRQKLQDSTIESLISSQIILEKSLNLKVGSLKGNLAKQRQQSDVVAEFKNFEDLQKWAQEKGIKIPGVDEIVKLPLPDVSPELQNE